MGLRSLFLFFPIVLVVVHACRDNENLNECERERDKKTAQRHIDVAVLLQALHQQSPPHNMKLSLVFVLLLLHILVPDAIQAAALFDRSDEVKYSIVSLDHMHQVGVARSFSLCSHFAFRDLISQREPLCK